MSKKVLLLVGIGVPVIAIGIGLFAWLRNRPVEIAEVLERCREEAVDVRVAGRVAQVHEVPLLDVSVYRFVDDRESIWVFTQRPAPREDREMVVVGTAASSTRFRGRCLDFLADEAICDVAGKVVRLVAGPCVLFEDRRE